MCWNCQKSGHFKKDCRNPKKERDNFANVVTEDVADALPLAVHVIVNDWVMDSSASFHTISHKKIMTNYVVNDLDKVYLVDG